MQPKHNHELLVLSYKLVRNSKASSLFTHSIFQFLNSTVEYSTDAYIIGVAGISCTQVLRVS